MKGTLEMGVLSVNLVSGTRQLYRKLEIWEVDSDGANQESNCGDNDYYFTQFFVFMKEIHGLI